MDHLLPLSMASSFGILSGEFDLFVLTGQGTDGGDF